MSKEMFRNSAYSAPGRNVRSGENVAGVDNVIEIQYLHQRDAHCRQLINPLRPTEQAVDQPVGKAGERAYIVPHIAIEHKPAAHLLAYEHPVQLRYQQRRATQEEREAEQQEEYCQTDGLVPCIYAKKTKQAAGGLGN
jgi:tryptophanase